VHDPERDTDLGAAHWYWRALVIIGFGALLTAVLWPSITVFTVTAASPTSCVAVADAFHDSGERSKACAPEARDRMVASGVGVATVALVVVAIAIYGRKRSPQVVRAPRWSTHDATVSWRELQAAALARSFDPDRDRDRVTSG
jgi:hypothetical protein